MEFPTVKAEAKVDLTKVAEAVYVDGVSASVKELSKVGTDVAKSARLLLIPLQLLGAVQDRVEAYIARSIAQIPPEKRVNPIRSVALPILEKLRYQEEGELLTEIYLNLLSRTFDLDRFGEAHPAFLNLLNQLSSDEAKLLHLFAASDFQIIFADEPGVWPVSTDTIDEFISDGFFQSANKEWLAARLLDVSILDQPKYLHVYIEHLVSLGLLTYSNTHFAELNHKFAHSNLSHGTAFWSLCISKFGLMLHKACVQEAVEPGLCANKSDRL